MRLAALVLVLCATPALACDDRLLTIDDDWTIEVAEAGARLVLTYKNAGRQAFRKIDATVEFSDRTEMVPLASVTLDRDLRLLPGDSARMERTYQGPRLLRIMRMDRSDVAVKACVWSVDFGQ